MNKEYLVVYCTCPDQKVAEHIAGTLVDEALSACVNILPEMTSVYRWQDHIERDSEYLLIIKTHSAVYPALEARIGALHPYEVPEIIALPVRQGNTAYLDWIDSSVQFS